MSKNAHQLNNIPCNRHAVILSLWKWNNSRGQCEKNKCTSD